MKTHNLLIHIKEFLNDSNNIKNIENRSEADFQFELGYFLKAIKNIDNIRFEYQFKDLYRSNSSILKKEADICVLNNTSVDDCIEIKLLKKNSGSTNLFASCFEDICYLLQLKNDKKISKGYFVLLCSDTSVIKSKRNSIGSEFWKGFKSENTENNLLKKLGEYKEDDLPNPNSFHHPKLRELIKGNFVAEGLAEKIIEYSIISTKNSEYAYCIVEI